MTPPIQNRFTESAKATTNQNNKVPAIPFFPPIEIEQFNKLVFGKVKRVTGIIRSILSQKQYPSTNEAIPRNATMDVVVNKLSANNIEIQDDDTTLADIEPNTTAVSPMISDEVKYHLSTALDQAVGNIVRNTDSSELTSILETIHIPLKQLLIDFKALSTYADALIVEYNKDPHSENTTIVINQLEEIAKPAYKLLIELINSHGDDPKSPIKLILHTMKSALGFVAITLPIEIREALDDKESVMFYANTIQNYLKKITEQANHLTNALNDESERNSFEKLENIELKPLIKETIDTYRVPLQNKGIYISINVPENITIRGNHEIVEGAFDTLFGNAADFCTENGLIVISVSNISNEKVSLQFFNTGPTLPEHFHLDGKRNRSTHGGCGIALAATFNNLLKTGGKIEAQKVEEGVAFELTFPREIRRIQKENTSKDITPANDLIEELSLTGTDG